MYMRISTLAFANLNRRKGKALFLTIGIAVGIGTVVALLSLAGSIQEEIGAQLDRFGARGMGFSVQALALRPSHHDGKAVS